MPIPITKKCRRCSPGPRHLLSQGQQHPQRKLSNTAGEKNSSVATGGWSKAGMSLKDEVEEPERALSIVIVFAVVVRNNGIDDRARERRPFSNRSATRRYWVSRSPSPSLKLVETGAFGWGLRKPHHLRPLSVSPQPWSPNAGHASPDHAAVGREHVSQGAKDSETAPKVRKPCRKV